MEIRLKLQDINQVEIQNKEESAGQEEE